MQKLYVWTPSVRCVPYEEIHNPPKCVRHLVPERYINIDTMVKKKQHYWHYVKRLRESCGSGIKTDTQEDPATGAI